MRIILFQPFDFGKWCAISLSAFLAGLVEGGNGVNGSFNYNGGLNNDNFGNNSGGQIPKLDLHQFNSQLVHYFTGAQWGLIVLIVVAVMAIVFAIILLIYWLGARGEFMFLDNVVRNRGAISWPWQFYRRQANSLFGFYLLVMVISFSLVLPIVIGVALVCIPLLQHQRWPVGGEIVMLVLLFVAYFVLAIAMATLLFVFREFGIPIMFRQGILARPAFWQSMRLIGRFPGSIAVFVLLRIAIFIGVAIVSMIVCCLTCCIGMLPYIGTIILLPVLVYIKCFTLDCLEQFGPEYNVWTIDVAPVSHPQQP